MHIIILLMNNIQCTFKLAYTCNVFTKIIDVYISPYDLKNIITSDVNNQMRLTEFKIIIGGTDLGEDNIDLDCNISDVSISSLVGTIYNNHIPFYIKPVYNNDDESDSDCPICYTSFESVQTVRFSCSHIFCRSCTSNWFRTGVVSCPICRS